MPHLSPMNWILFMILIWLMVLLWTSINSHFNPPSFPTTNFSKPTLMSKPWKWV